MDETTNTNTTNAAETPGEAWWWEARERFLVDTADEIRDPEARRARNEHIAIVRDQIAILRDAAGE